MNHLQITKVHLALGFDDEFVLLLRKLTFQNKDKSETSDIRKGILNRSINLVVYLIECKSCFRQYVGSSITPFRSRFNDSKSGTKKVSKNVISIKSNLIVTLLLSLIGQKIF